MRANNHPSPPRLAEKLLLWFLKDELAEEVLGDLDEKFYRTAEKHTTRKARRNYWYQVINYLRPFALKSGKLRITNNIMITQNLKNGYHHLLRNAGYTLINVIGLAIAMGVCLTIYQYIDFEKSYDRFHTKAENIYRLVRTNSENSNKTGSVLQTYALGPAAKEEIPEIKLVTRIRSHYDGILIVTDPQKNTPLKESGILSVDNSFFEMFDFPLQLGDKKAALDAKNKVVISQDVAHRHFGDENPLNKTLKVRGGAVNGDFIISGVLEPIPTTSHLQFDLLFPIETEIERYGFMNMNGWDGGSDFATYSLINDPTKLPFIAEKIDGIIKSHAKNITGLAISFQSLADIHLKSAYENDVATANGQELDIILFSIIACFLLLIAWANYINMATAKALKRIKEVGIKKAIGAFRSQLIGQFLAESFLINLFAATLAIGVAYFCLPLLRETIDQPITFNLLASPSFWAYASAIIVLGTLLSGFYPAFILSGFKPINMLSGQVARTRGLGLRKGLIIFQFMISLLLISGTYVIYNQISFMKHRDLGVDMEKILIVETHRTGQPWAYHKAAQETFKNEVKKYASVLDATGSGRVPGRGFNARAQIRKPETAINEGHSGDMIYADNDFISTYGLKYIAYDSITTAIYEAGKATVINKNAAYTLGFQSAQDAINKKIIAGRDTFVVKGVVDDFHWGSLKEPYSPHLFLVRPGGRTYFSVKMNLANIKETLDHIESSYRSVFPENPYNSFFLDYDFNRQYKSDLRFGKLFAAFSTLTIFIACIGLFALASYSTTLRTKEIGIRKVLGAKVAQLIILLSKEYLWLILIVITVTTPIIFYLGENWLDNYAFRINLGLKVIAIPAIVLLMITVSTIWYQTYSRAKSNPVKSLRSE